MEKDPSHDLLVAKVVSMVVLGVVSFIVGTSPIKITKLLKIKTSEDNLLISLLLCFGGGVLLFTTFIHLQPEVRESFAQLESTIEMPSIKNIIPLSEFVFCLGFFFVYMVEELVHLFLERKPNHDALHRSLSTRCALKDNISIPRLVVNKEDVSISCISTSNKELLNSENNVNFVDTPNKHSHMHLDEDVKNSFSGLVAVLALSFHAIFEGLAVGLEKKVDKVWYLFLAIATHKFVIAFCVGVELVSSKVRTLLVMVYIGTFAVVTPVGIGLGITLSGSDTSAIALTSVLLQGMAAGTLLYVVFFEVLARERNNQHSGVWQLVAIIAGFALMFGLQVATGHEHDHALTEPTQKTTSAYATTFSHAHVS